MLYWVLRVSLSDDMLEEGRGRTQQMAGTPYLPSAAFWSMRAALEEGRSCLVRLGGGGVVMVGRWDVLDVQLGEILA